MSQSDFHLSLVRQRRVTECAEGEGKHVLPRPAGFKQPRRASLPPLAQSPVVELPQTFGNDETCRGLSPGTTASFATASREFERRAKRFRVSTTGPTAFVSRVTRVFVNGVKRRFVFARSAQLTVHELTRISRIQIEFVQIREDSWTRLHPLRFRRGPKSPCASDHKK